MNNKFTSEDTNFSKGVAVCLLVVHHLFWCVPNVGLSINGMALSQRIGIIGKVCVAIFIILSGYGINESSKCNFDLKQYYKKRVFKLYLNYWVIVVLSLLIGLLFFYDKMIPIIGGDVRTIIVNFIKNISGIQFIVNYRGYNGAWWYITLAVLFYIVYPVIRKLMQKYNHAFLIVASILLLSNYLPLNVLNMKNILPWIFHFILGVYLSHNNGFEYMYLFMKKGVFGKYIKTFLLVLLTLVILYNRQFIGQNIYGIRIDAILGLLIVIINYIYFSKINILKKVMITLGIYSLDIFLVHMFLSTYFTREFTYSLKYPIAMFIYVLATSLIISMLLKILKDKLGINKILKYITKETMNRREG